jgi:hypothetical protein
VRSGIAEIGDHAVAEVPRRIAVEALYRPDTCPLVAAEHLAEVLGVEQFGNRRGLDEVAEHHRHVPSVSGLFAAGPPVHDHLVLEPAATAAAEPHSHGILQTAATALHLTHRPPTRRAYPRAGGERARFPPRPPPAAQPLTSRRLASDPRRRTGRLLTATLADGVASAAVAAVLRCGAARPISTPRSK